MKNKLILNHGVLCWLNWYPGISVSFLLYWVTFLVEVKVNKPTVIIVATAITTSRLNSNGNIGTHDGRTMGLNILSQKFEE